MSTVSNRAHKVAVITGEVWYRAFGSTDQWKSMGEVDECSISHSQAFTDVRAARDPNRPLLAHVARETDMTLAFKSKTFDNDTLALALMGTDGGAQNAGSVADEAAKAYNGGYIFTAKPGISNVAISKGATPLVKDTDFTYEAASGRIYFMPGSLIITAGAGHDVTIDYDYAAYAGTVSVLTQTTKDYEFLIDGYNLADANAPVIVRIPKATMEIAKQVQMLGAENASLDMEGRILVTGSSAPYTITRK